MFVRRLRKLRILFYLACASCICIIFTWAVVNICTCGVNNYDKRITEMGSNEQKTEKLKLKTYLIIMILSEAKESAIRDVIRNTWLKLSSKGPKMYRHLFFVGTNGLAERELYFLREENQNFGDLILLDDLKDSYANLTKKVLLSIDRICQLYTFDYLLKIDSDSFVRLGALLKGLKDVAHPLLYWGFLDGRAKPRRNGPWAEKDWVLCDRYLPYQLGGGYVLSFTLANYISKNKKLLKLFRNEDVSVGAWLAGLNVHYIHDPRFDTEFKSRGCNNEYIITHKKTAEDMQNLYMSMISVGKLCKKEFRVRPSYVYDWSVSPSMCCTRNNASNIP